MEVNFPENYDFAKIRNVTQQLVLEVLEEELRYFEKEEICMCQQCILDMTCYALCHAPIRYEVSIFSRKYLNNYSYQEEIREAVQKAIEIVNSFPNH